MYYFLEKKLLNVGPKLSYLGIFGLALEEATVVFYISTLNFFQTQNFVQK